MHTTYGKSDDLEKINGSACTPRFLEEIENMKNEYPRAIPGWQPKISLHNHKLIYN